MLALLDVSAAAKLLAISPWTVRLYVRRGALPIVRVGRRVLIEPAALEEFIAARRSLPKPEPNLGP